MQATSLKTKLAWQCRRGMLELDVVLIPFLEQHFDSLDSNQQELFSRLLEQDDPDLYSWIMGFDKSENENFNSLIQLIRNKLGIKS